MKVDIASLIFCTILLFASCGKDDDTSKRIEVPETYDFLRAGQSSVSFDGQTTRILMAEELISALKGFNTNETTLLEMYANETIAGEDANPFTNADLNASTKSIRSKTAASIDYFSSNTVDAAEIKNQFANWISAQVTEVAPAQNQLASPGIPGQIADGTSTRYVNANGLEYNQIVNKGLIGALMVDQILNNYLSPSVLDAGENMNQNDLGITEEGKSYTTMEHKWDEAYGYLYGNSANQADPNLSIGSDDSFLNKYTGSVDADADFTGIANDIFEAFKMGRAAIVAGDYQVRDEQARIIRNKISEIIAVRAVFYLQQGKNAILNNNTGSAFHNLSEGYGFIYSLQFTRNPSSNNPHFSKSEVENFLSSLLNDGANGLWDIKPETLEFLSEAIVTQFDFTLEMARD